jgi:hypothetical protein
LRNKFQLKKRSPYPERERGIKKIIPKHAQIDFTVAISAYFKKKKKEEQNETNANSEYKG